LSTLRIRRAREPDAGAILAMEEHFPGDRMSARSVRHFLRSPRALVLIAEAGGVALGCLVMLTRKASRCARIYSVVVTPAARGRGLGRRLVQSAERAARVHGCAAMALEVRQDNAAAQALYAGLGYEVETRLGAYYEDGGDGLRLRRRLRAG
jgi:ribosomal-protein-alanine N-acetyltransferase